MAAVLAPVGEAAALAREIALLGDEREVRTILEWVGFSTALQRERIATESFQDYVDIQSLKEKDITEISDSFQNVTRHHKELCLDNVESGSLKP